MDRRVIYHDAALREISDAVDIGQLQWPDLVDGLVAELDFKITEIIRNPEIYRLRKLGVRRVNLNRYPYHIIFREIDAGIQILSFGHDREAPERWLHRLPDNP